jgi:hypothetical protein
VLLEEKELLSLSACAKVFLFESFHFKELLSLSACAKEPTAIFI